MGCVYALTHYFDEVCVGAKEFLYNILKIYGFILLYITVCIYCNPGPISYIQVAEVCSDSDQGH